MDLMKTAQLLGNFGEFVGSVFVVGTFIYLAIQVRHSRQAMEVSNFHQAIEQAWSITQQIAGDAELAAILERGDADPAGLSDVELRRYHAALSCLTFGQENTFALYERGLVPPDYWENLIDNANLRSAVLAPGRSGFLAQRNGPISRRFRDHIEAAQSSPVEGSK